VITPEFQKVKGSFPCGEENSGNLILICETGFLKDTLTLLLNDKTIYSSVISTEAKSKRALNIIIEKKNENKSILRLKVNREEFRLRYKEKYCYLHLYKSKKGYTAIANNADTGSK